ncbi:hypothetical protein AO385_1368 [Moraxella catarrhalis]|uniref:Uncharacterized protein n=1 Tax=Moraxella catarrhalis TaxID=480 RepID=A0A7Z0UWP1_MORCA|nr:hypothetical protein AO383_2124 [Moraxella catarrhalis]OAU99257.1 hypothetical protein AO382_2100 [Moraxella catarrhalis]OAU99585.1 hypothetical protein AO385_1368 [Moraxella catarrhalis]
MPNLPKLQSLVQNILASKISDILDVSHSNKKSWLWVAKFT